MTTKRELHQKVLRAKVALALYSEFGKVPTEQEIEHTYHLTRVMYKAVLGTHFLRKKQKQQDQLAIF